MKGALLGPEFKQKEIEKILNDERAVYKTLEEETGQATGYKQIGSLSLARNKERLEELKRNASMAKVFGVKSEMIVDKSLIIPFLSKTAGFSLPLFPHLNNIIFYNFNL